MATDQGSINRVTLTGCDFREYTGDKVGGTTLYQNAGLSVRHGVAVEIHTGSKVLSVWDLATRIQAGRGAVIQIGTKPMLSTKHRSTSGAINHAVHVARVRGGSLGTPSEALVYDPAADGRDRSYHVATGPEWWPWSLVRECLAALQPWGEQDPRTLGHGKAYCALFPDTKPHVHLRAGATRASPFPDRTRVDAKEVWRHQTPHYGTANRVGAKPLERNELFTVYQRITNAQGRWAGNHDGDAWVTESKLRNIGGTQ